MTSPGIPGTYAQLAGYLATTARRAATRRIKRTAHRLTTRCYCGGCDR